MKIRRSCKDVTGLVLESHDRPLSTLEALSLRLHWLACSSCSRFKDQQRLIRVALDRWKLYRDAE